jgi:hypothetical protein
VIACIKQGCVWWIACTIMGFWVHEPWQPIVYVDTLNGLLARLRPGWLIAALEYVYWSAAVDSLMRTEFVLHRNRGLHGMG